MKKSAIIIAATALLFSAVSCKKEVRMDKEFYIGQVESIFDYWKQYRDAEFGGILNCISNDGTTLVSNDKYAWSQGRWLYVLSKLYEMKDTFTGIDSEFVRAWMDETNAFLKEKCLFGDDCRTCFLLRQDGTMVLDEATGRYDSSIYADCFLLIGMSEYAKATGIYDDILEKVADSIMERELSGDYLSAPYAIPEGYTVHGIPMIMMNTYQVFCDMEKLFCRPCEKYDAYQDDCFNRLWFKHFDRENWIIREYVSTDENRKTLLADRHFNPGHNLEDVWFIIDYMESRGILEQYQEEIDNLTRKAFELGWDKQYGGLLRYVDYEQADGTQEVKGVNTHTAYDELVASTWDMKLWWAHSEIVYLFARLYVTTGNPEWLDYYAKAYDYAFSTFPSKDNAEWTQIRKRDGSPQDKVVALPVKDPFHIMRNFIKIVEIL